MKIPKKIKVGGIEYQIRKMKKRQVDEIDGEYIPVADGRVNIDKQFIEFLFDPDIKQDYKEFIFFHELTHLLFYYAWTGKTKSWKDETEVNNFAFLLYQVLKDNNLLR